MAAPIKPIDDKSIHLIESGQVIVDLCSVVKELVENSIDSGANIIDVRFKNQGLDRIEVQDNGSGISPANHSSVALKHYTSKLSCYSDIGSLQTFGFRGEALASLCALSHLTITTCIETDVPKGSKLSFDASGILSSTGLSAAQRGTTVSVEALFYNLPVRRRELERNIKREWHKVISLLNQYACIQTNLKLSVSQQPTKGKRVLLFSTKGNRTTRENIINIFGSKAMSALVPIDIVLEMEPSRIKPATRVSPSRHSSRQVRVKGHVSRPMHGDGRQTPDRQMFFVNGRPCGLPQVSKVFNEVYKSYNCTQSPFIFADIQLDTNMYDVNVSPDKRSILLHDQASLLDSIRTSLGAVFDNHEHRLPAASVLSLHPSESPISHGPISSLITMENKSSNAEEHSCMTDDAEIDERSASGSRKTGVQPNSEMTTEKGSRTVGKRQSALSKWLNHDVEPEIFPVLGIEASKIKDSGPKVQERRTSVESSLGNFKYASDMISNDSADVGLSSPRASIRQDRNDELISKREPSCQTSCIGSDAENLDVDISSQCSKKPACLTMPCMEEDRISLDAEESLGKSSKLRHETPAVLQNTVNAADKRYLSKFELKNGIVDPIVYHQRSAEMRETDRQGIQTQISDSPTQNQQQLRSGSNVEISLVDDARNRNGQEMYEPAATVKANYLNEGRKRRFKNAQTLQVIYTTEEKIALFTAYLGQDSARNLASDFKTGVGEIDASDAESKLSLIISKDDFAKMRVVGQFNLGFIIAIRPRPTSIVSTATDAQDELFIIDQHASDEKFNFEKLQANTVLQSQQLVHPKRLDLTALEEEIVLGNLGALEANGFQVQVDATGAAPVGSRCQLLALPLSREMTFTLKDLEDLISLLADEPAGSEHFPRPSAVRKMFAMRACRSSIMIGTALTISQMYTIIRHMGELDKPWNCPHGRPTMRHLCHVQAWDEARWRADTLSGSTSHSWASYISNTYAGS